MTTEPHSKKGPRGLQRWFNRAPVWLYRLGLGGLMGKSVMLLTHTGRKSGLPRQTVVEVAQYDPASETFYALSGWGPQSDWVRNVQAHPQIEIQVGRRKYQVRAERLSPEAGAQVLLAYGRRRPGALQLLAQRMGYAPVESGADSLARGLSESIPVFAFRQ